MDLLQQPYVQALARALGHFVWQGAAIGLGLHVIVRVVRPSAHARYLMAVGCLALMVLAPIVTTMWLAESVSRTAFTSAGGSQAIYTLATSSGLAGSAAPVRAVVGWNLSAVVIVVWLAGVAALSVRLVGGWVVTRRLVQGARRLASADVRGLAQRMAGRLALDRLVDVLESSSIAVPVMIGWIKPVVILPTAAIAGLTPVQVEALIAHELAHVRRHDYLVNLLQSAVETLLFYHPAVWWVSRTVREAREQCCDDLAVGVCDRVVYASALADLAAMSAAPKFALAATDGSLVERVRRILGQGETPKRTRPGLVAAFVLSLIVGGLVPIAFTSAQSTPPTKPVDVSTTPVTAPAVPSNVTVTAQTPAVQLSSAEPAVGLAIAQTPEQDASAQRERTAQELELQAKIERLRAMLADLSVTLKKLKAEGRDESDQTEYLQQLREKVTTAVADLDTAKVTKEIEQQLLEQQKAANKALDEKRVEEIQRQLEKKNSELNDQVNAEMKMRMVDQQRTIEEQMAALKDLKQLTVIGSSELDQQVISQLGPVLRAEPGDVSVVGGVAHPGPMKWEDGMTVGKALERAGVQGDRAGYDLVRIRALSFSWGNEGMTSSRVKLEPVDPSTPLHAGDVIGVIKKKGGGE